MKKTVPKISVIVPFWDVEDYIEKCLQALFNQTYHNLEIITINDGSVDKSGLICEKYSKEKKIKYLENDKHRGLSYTRNHGLKEATGDYIAFIDADDYVDNNYFESLYNNIKDADICICDITVDYGDKKVRKQCGNKKLDKEQFINCGLAASACNKLFKASIFKDVKFEEGKINEDVPVIVPLMLRKKIAYDPDVTYYYVQRPNSIQSSPITEEKIDIIHAVNLTIDRIKKHPDSNKYKDIIIFQQIILFLLYVPEKESNFYKRYQFLRKFRQKCPYRLSNNKYFIEELDQYGKLSKAYYKLLMKLFDYRFILLVNLIITTKKIRSNNRKKRIPDNITMQDLIEEAKKEKKSIPNYEVSVVIPNYNYSKYLFQRVYSILYQSYKVKEIIILDDCSKDNSQEIIDEIVKELSPIIDIKKDYNKKNTGKPFIQWEKGMNMAKYPYVWIAEADDYSHKEFLKEAMSKFQENVIISYTDTAFVDSSGKQILKSVKKQVDLRNTGHWDHSYINNGNDEFKDFAFLNCTIANVSGAVIRKGDYAEGFQEAKKYKQAGDWVFYSYLMHLGDVAYSKKTYNYYRVHDNNVSTVTKKEDHIQEIKNIYNYYDQKYSLNSFQKDEMKKRCDFLKKVWRLDKKDE